MDEKDVVVMSGIGNDGDTAAAISNIATVLGLRGQRAFGLVAEMVRVAFDPETAPVRVSQFLDVEDDSCVGFSAGPRNYVGMLYASGTKTIPSAAVMVAFVDKGEHAGPWRFETDQQRRPSTGATPLTAWHNGEPVLQPSGELLTSVLRAALSPPA